MDTDNKQRRAGGKQERKVASLRPLAIGQQLPPNRKKKSARLFEGGHCLNRLSLASRISFLFLDGEICQVHETFSPSSCDSTNEISTSAAIFYN